jgi:hypothetical protein
MPKTPSHGRTPGDAIKQTAGVDLNWRSWSIAPLATAMAFNTCSAIVGSVTSKSWRAPTLAQEVHR